jgi:hypothetical protein
VSSEVWSVLTELAKPVTFILCILSLYALFMTAFLLPSNDMHQKICDCLGPLMLAAGVSLISGLIFLRAMPEPGNARLVATLPVQLFVWASGIMLVLFIVSWYLESHCIFYRDVRF